MLDLTLYTIFARSDAVVTIYSIAQFSVASIQERHLLISVNLSFVPRPLPCFQCTLDTADEAEESDPFTDIEEDENKLENKLILDDC